MEILKLLQNHFDKIDLKLTATIKMAQKLEDYLRIDYNIDIFNRDIILEIINK